MLTLEQRKKLKNAGYNDAKINAFETKKFGKSSKEGPTFGGQIVRDIAKPFARLATNVYNLGEMARGKQKSETTQPFSGEYLGEVKPVGQEGSFARKVGESVGVGAEIGTTLVGGGAAGGVAKAGFKGALKQAAKTAMKEGAVVGGGQGFGSSLERGESVGKTLANTALGTAAGVVGGGLTAGVGAGTRAVTKGVQNVAEKAVGLGKKVVGKGEATVEKQAQNALDAVTPSTNELTPTEYKELLGKGKITPKTLTSPSQYVLSDAEKAAAQKYQPLLQSKDPVKNSINVINEISNKDKQVGEFLTKNNGIFNNGELKNHILENLKDITDITIPEARTNKLKQTMVDGFIKALNKNDMKSLWQSRKAFDRSIEKVFSGAPTLQNQMKREFRNAIQDFISDRTPEGVYKGYMKDMRELFSLQEILENKATRERGRNALQVWLKNNPNKAKAIGWTLGAVGAGQLFSAVQ